MDCNPAFKQIRTQRGSTGCEERALGGAERSALRVGRGKGVAGLWLQRHRGQWKSGEPEEERREGDLGAGTAWVPGTPVGEEGGVTGDLMVAWSSQAGDQRRPGRWAFEGGDVCFLCGAPSETQA